MCKRECACGPCPLLVPPPRWSAAHPAAAQAPPAVLYLLWAYVPDRTLWCHGVSYYPSKCVRLEGVCTNALGWQRWTDGGGGPEWVHCRRCTKPSVLA